ncbi:peptidoglycan-binding protein [bacterium]|nr:MAG: peptidoglycan-binding protein [bacterium]
MKKFIIITLALAIAVPFTSFAQTTPTVISGGNALSACALPASPANASDWTSAVSCLQGRIDTLWYAIQKIESRLNALESRAISYPIYPTTPGGGGTAPSTPTTPIYGGTQGTPIGIPGTPIQGGATTPGTPIGSPASNAANSGQVKLQSGASNESVKAIQNFLKAEGSFTYPQATGYFGDITRNAVLQFQATQGLTQTGSVDNQTLQKMKAIAPQVAPSMSATMQSITVPSR